MVFWPVQSEDLRQVDLSEKGALQVFLTSDTLPTMTLTTAMVVMRPGLLERWPTVGTSCRAPFLAGQIRVQSKR